MRQTLVILALVALGGCPTKATKDNRRADEPAPTSDARAEEADEQVDPARQREEGRHTVVFADRTSQGYLLLVEGERPEVPRREALQELARRKLAAAEDEPELEILLELIGTEPSSAPRTLDERVANADPSKQPDLLGFHVDVLPVHGSEGVVSAELLTDPILTRALDPAQRASLARRRWAILLRADYRNQNAVRGLRLLQTLVRIVAVEHDALIHDPDIGETVDEAIFTQRRLRSTLGNVADQVAVVPFPDPAHPQHVRLSTRGMRRFGSVDLELGGLPPDPAVLQQATHLVHGLAHQMVRLGEYDSSGYAVELDPVVTIAHEDVARAYAGQSSQPPRCQSCPGRVDVHLVERDPEPHDPSDHVVARIVAPRSLSDAPDYDHLAWARRAVTDLLGP